MKDGAKNYDLLIYAMRKFTGGLGDEDEIDRSENDWQKYFLKDINNLEKFILLLSCASHDIAHPGNNNIFEINTKSELANIYNDKSVLENYFSGVLFRDFVCDREAENLVLFVDIYILAKNFYNISPVRQTLPWGNR